MNDLFSTISFISSIVSVVLAVLAIWLALYGKSEADKTNQKTQELLSDIRSEAKAISQVAMPELKAYGDSVRRYIFEGGEARIVLNESGMEINTTPTKNEIEERTNKKIESLKQDITKSIDHVIVNQSKSDQNFELIKIELNKIVSKAVEDTRIAENYAKFETLKNRIIEEVRSSNDKKDDYITVVHLYSSLGNTFSFADIATNLLELKKEKIIEWEGTRVHASEPLKLVDRKT